MEPKKYKLRENTLKVMGKVECVSKSEGAPRSRTSNWKGRGGSSISNTIIREEKQEADYNLSEKPKNPFA